MSPRPLVSIVMPCRNEETYIGRALDSILANDYPKECIEILVIDGQSTDRSREIVEQYASRSGQVRFLDNPRVVQTHATNIGLKAAKGDYIIRMDAHAEYAPEYIRKAVEWIVKTGSDAVGGPVETAPGGEGPAPEAIALALSSSFGVGNSHFRLGVREVRAVDTIAFGCYRKDVFERVGLFNENLIRTDDIEFNLRLRRAGGKLLLVPDVQSKYFARDSFRALARQNFWNGYWVLYSLRYARMPFSPRHLVPAAFVLGLTLPLLLSSLWPGLSIISYVVAGTYLATSSIVALRLCAARKLKLFPFLVASFAVLHILYGVGSVVGLMKLAVSGMGLTRKTLSAPVHVQKSTTLPLDPNSVRTSSHR